MPFIITDTNVELNESGDLDEYNSGSKTINETDIASNSFADVITVCNLAYDINCKYENDPTNNVIVDIIIDGNYYCVYPMADNGRPVLQKGQVFEGKSENVTATSTVVELFDLMEQGYDGTSFNEANYDDQNRLRYKYYFDSELHYGETEDSNELKNEGRVSQVIFTMIPNSLYTAS